MTKVYNTQKDITSSLRDFFKAVIPSLRKTQLNILPEIIFGMISSESVVSSDIAKSLKDEFSLVQLESTKKRIRRFFNNHLFDPYSFYDYLIRYVISTYKKKHTDNRIHIIFDHMFSHDNYVTLMFTMRIGKQGIPVWFRSFKEKSNNDAFKESLIIEGIKYVSSLFDNNYDLIFLADRWFNSCGILETINSLGCTYAIRLKKNIKIFIHDKNEDHKVWKWLYSLKPHKYHATVYKDIELFDSKYKTNIVLSKYLNTDDPWIIVTNKDIEHAIQNYSFRFGAIECVFKNQKSNGFFLESVNNASEKAYVTMYALVCTATLFLTIIGADYSKNTKCYKTEKITTHKNYSNGKKVRVMSLFKVGLTLFHRAFNSLKYIRIPFKFILYDI